MMHECKACKARITLGIYCEVCERQVGLLTQIAALEGEVARVKAESLRVVVDGEQRQAYGCSKVLHDGRVCFVHTRALDDYFPLQISDFVTGKYVDKVACETMLQPVRLERWEDEG